MISNYISIKSVIYDLSLTIDDRYYNETKALEWATKALRIIGPESALEAQVALVNVTQHKFPFPCDLKYLTQIGYIDDTLHQDNFADLQFPPDSTLTPTSFDRSFWKPLRLASSSLHLGICLDQNIYACPGCDKEFTLDPSMIATTTLEKGKVLISYLRYPKDIEGDSLIPDDESLKEALLHYILYRYWMSKYMMKEDGSDQRMKFHLDMWETLAQKAKGRLNMPGIEQLENLKQINNKMMPRNRYRKFFTTLSSYGETTF